MQLLNLVDTSRICEKPSLYDYDPQIVYDLNKSRVKLSISNNCILTM